MSYKEIINPSTGQIFEQLIPVSGGGIPTLEEVCGEGNSTNSIINCLNGIKTVKILDVGGEGGTNGQVLTSEGGDCVWRNVPDANLNLQQCTANGATTTNECTFSGGIIPSTIKDNAGASGQNDQVLGISGTQMLWKNIPSSNLNLQQCTTNGATTTNECTFSAGIIPSTIKDHSGASGQNDQVLGIAGNQLSWVNIPSSNLNLQQCTTNGATTTNECTFSGGIIPSVIKDNAGASGGNNQFLGISGTQMLWKNAPSQTLDSVIIAGSNSESENCIWNGLQTLKNAQIDLLKDSTGSQGTLAQVLAIGSSGKTEWQTQSGGGWSGQATSNLDMNSFQISEVKTQGYTQPIPLTTVLPSLYTNKFLYEFEGKNLNLIINTEALLYEFQFDTFPFFPQSNADLMIRIEQDIFNLPTNACFSTRLRLYDILNPTIFFDTDTFSVSQGSDAPIVPSYTSSIYTQVLQNPFANFYGKQSIVLQLYGKIVNYSGYNIQDSAFGVEFSYVSYTQIIN